jgi:hypothetical protein
MKQIVVETAPTSFAAATEHKPTLSHTHAENFGTTSGFNLTPVSGNNPKRYCTGAVRSSS